MTNRFGTSRWRVVTAEGFAFAGLRSVTNSDFSHIESKKRPDSFAVIDSDGSFITPSQIIALLFDYLVESRKWTGSAARSVATSHLVDRVAEAHGLPGYETPVGFKYIGEPINEDKIVIGGEESAGLSIKGHYPEEDGILARLLAAEAVAARGASLTKQLCMNELAN